MNKFLFLLFISVSIGAQESVVSFQDIQHYSLLRSQNINIVRLLNENGIPAKRLLWGLNNFTQNSVFLSSKDPVPYSIDEFPTWVRAIGRMEAIFVGAIPIAVFFSTIVYDIYRYTINYQKTGKSDPRYFPSIISSTHESFKENEQRNIFLASLGVAATVVVVDLIIDQIKLRHGKY